MVAVAARLGRLLLIAAAVVAPVVTAWLGVHELALHLESLQPDGDLEGGGSFALGVLLVELVLVNYVASVVLVLALWRWVGGSPLRCLLTVVGASVTTTAIGVALSWT